MIVAPTFRNSHDIIFNDYHKKENKSSKANIIRPQKRHKGRIKCSFTKTTITTLSHKLVAHPPYSLDLVHRKNRQTLL